MRRRCYLTSIRKYMLLHFNRRQHIYEVSFRITAAGEDRITATGDTRVTAGST